jgi:hypothetical protein
MNQLCWILLLLINLSLSQSTISLEQYATYRDCEDEDCGEPDDLEYIADLNNSLERYLGTWEGVTNNKKIIYKIERSQYTNVVGVKKDIITIRYRLIDIRTGNLILDTFTVPNDKVQVIDGFNYINGDYYALYYGFDGCGQDGYAILDHDQHRLTGEVTFKIHILLTGEPFDPSQCPNGRPESPIPSGVELKKV